MCEFLSEYFTPSFYEKIKINNTLVLPNQQIAQREPNFNKQK